MIDIRGIDKGALLAGLFNAADVHWRTMCDAMARLGDGVGVVIDRPRIMTPELGSEIIASTGATFDYIGGRPLKVNIEGDAFDESLYDRDNGAGTAATVVAALRKPIAKCCAPILTESAWAQDSERKEGEKWHCPECPRVFTFVRNPGEQYGAWVIVE